MSSSNRKTEPRPGPGNLLRYWRQQRGRSQFDLSLEAGVSQRHISFVESGRSVASRDLVLCLSQALDVPIRERNLLLAAAGYAPMYPETPWNAPEMAMVQKAVDCILAQHEPHPAVVLDRHWNVIRTNEAAPRFFNRFVDLASRKEPPNILHLMLDPEGVRPFVENWERVASSLIERVYREAVGHVIDEKTVELLNELKKYPGVAELRAGGRSHVPVLPITFVKNGEKWSYFSMISTIGTPHCVTAQEFRIECMFPVENDPGT